MFEISLSMRNEGIESSLFLVLVMGIEPMTSAS